MSIIRIAVADDQALVRSGLTALVNGFSDCKIAVAAADGETLLQALSKTPVDLVLCDVRMQGMDGFQVVEKLRASGNVTPVILLTTFDESDSAIRAVECGAQGFLLKDASAVELEDAIRRVANGNTLVAPVATTAIRERYTFAAS